VLIFCTGKPVNPTQKTSVLKLVFMAIKDGVRQGKAGKEAVLAGTGAVRIVKIKEDLQDFAD